MSDLAADQPRENNGQFGSHFRGPNPGVVQNERMASFSFPPPGFATAAEHIAFFQSAPVSERILANAQFAYSDRRKMQVLWEQQRKGREYDFAAKFKKPWAVKLYEKAEQGVKEGRAFTPSGYINELHAVEERERRPMDIHPRNAEKIMRVAWAYRMSAGLPEEESLAVDNALSGVEEYDERADEWREFTYKEVVQHYETSAWVDEAVQDTDLRVAKMMERMIEVSDRGE